MNSSRTTETRFVVSLSQADPADPDAVGVKAANLAALRSAGFNVPDGVVLVANAYTEFAEQLADDSDVQAISDEIRAQLADSLVEFGHRHLAVRSSSVAEDLSGSSFAGQYETVLNVHGTREVEVAVLRCWVSASAPTVDEYRRRRGLSEAPMAVLIQGMVDAVAAGVAFSANPVSGRRDEVVINAVKGLGDRLVAGEVSPDEWTVRDSDVYCETSAGGAIDAAQAEAIAETTRSVANHFGEPQDVEWAIDRNGQLHVLQARPITSIPKPPVAPIPIDFDVPAGFWQRDPSHQPRAGYHVDLLFFPITRRTTQRWAHEFGYIFDGIEMHEFGLWPYVRMVPVGGKERPTPPQWVMWLAARLMPTLRHRIRNAEDAVHSHKADRFVERWYETWQPELAEAIASYRDADLTSMTDTDLDRHIDSAHELVERGFDVHNLLTGSLAIILYELASMCEELLEWDLGRTLELVSGTSYKSTEPARRLHDLAEIASTKPGVIEMLSNPGDTDPDSIESVDAEFAELFAEYLREYGCRALGYSVAEPTLAEMPNVFVDMIRGQLGAGYDPKTHEESSAKLRQEAVDEARRMLDSEEADRFESSLERARRAYPVREDNEFFTISAPIALLRYAILELGRRLVNREVISERDDVRFLKYQQARSALHHPERLHDLVQLRKGQRAWAVKNPGPPSYGEPPLEPPSFDFLPSEARIPMEALLWNFEHQMAMGLASESGTASTLHGFAASPGQYTGPVRVVMDETDFDKLQPGDVLVCPITSPVWSVLFPSIGALVTDVGGVLSHPAIIAREYQIPAVVATGDATERLADDDIVTVDGAGGLVKLQ